MVNDVLRRIEKRLHSVMDPELPFLTVMELGMIRGIMMESDTAVIELTPTYTVALQPMPSQRICKRQQKKYTPLFPFDW